MGNMGKYRRLRHFKGDREALVSKRSWMDGFVCVSKFKCETDKYAAVPVRYMKKNTAARVVTMTSQMRDPKPRCTSSTDVCGLCERRVALKSAVDSVQN